MNIKALLFAGGGLMISMILTTIWINNDMQAIKAREAAKKQQACAAMLASGGIPNASTTSPAAGSTSGTPDAATDCGSNTTSTGSVTPGDPAMNTYDAADPQAAPGVVSTDPAAAPGGYDSYAGGTDPSYTDPGAAPAAGLPLQ